MHTFKTVQYFNVITSFEYFSYALHSYENERATQEVHLSCAGVEWLIQKRAFLQILVLSSGHSWQFVFRIAPEPMIGRVLVKMCK